MNQALAFFILVPLLGFILLLFMPKRNENLISNFTFSIALIQLASSLLFTIYWLFIGSPMLNIKEFTIYKSIGYEFFVDFYYDKVTAVYLFVGALLTFLIVSYSKYYLHREKGFKRFFITIIFFYLGYNVIIFSGNFETLFVGWEILGISSFLLIAYYRERYLPVKNAFKIYSLYRVADIALILAMWLSHHLWHHNITFMELNNFLVVDDVMQEHMIIGMVIAIIISLAAAIKSAQFPFSSWLPRAMEGPTPSSAIFYSSLAVHMGAFLLLRTFPLWENLIIVRIIIVTLGLISTILATLTTRVQSTIKSQVAYSSVAQIGLVFIEIALGFDNLALIHFMGNAFLRSYQLLVSPSVVTYLIREQFYQPKMMAAKVKKNTINKIKNSIYVMCLKEWNTDSYLFRLGWNPLKKVGRVLNFINLKFMALLIVPLYLLGVYFLFYGKSLLSEGLLHQLPAIFSFIGLLLVFKAFAERKDPMLSWLLIIFNHFWIVLAVSFNEQINISHMSMYLSGVIISGIVGFFGLRKLAGLEKNPDLNAHYGWTIKHPIIAQVFFFASLGLAGFPITTTFLGEDLIYSHIHEDQLLFVVFVSLSFVLDGLALIRMYIRLFLGSEWNTYKSTALRSS